MEKERNLKNKETIDLNKYAAKYRRKHGITIEELSRGLCTTSQISGWENDNGSIDFGIRYRIMSRLFVEDYSSGWKVSHDEYVIWRKQNNIVWLLCNEKYEEARVAIENYENERELKPLEIQFILRIKAVYLMCVDGDKDEIYRLTKEAFDITVPDFELEKMKDMILSSFELDMILDMERHSTNRRKVYGAVIGYLISREIEAPYQRKILPKATYYYIDAIDIDRIDNAEWAVVLNDKINYAIDCLRDTGYLNYMLELLSKKIVIIKKIIEILPKEKDYYQGALNKTQERVDVIAALYTEFEVRKDTILIPDTFAPSSVYDMSEIVYKRRQMLGISQNRLAKDTCDIKTVRRWEQGKTVPQEYIRNLIFDKLNLLKSKIAFAEATILPFKGGMLEYNSEIWGKRKEYEYKVSYMYDLESLVDEELENGLDYYGDEAGYGISNVRYPEKVLQEIESRYPVDAIIKAEVCWFDRAELFQYFNYITFLKASGKDYTEYLRALKAYGDEMIGTDLELAEWVFIEYLYDSAASSYGDEGKYDESNGMSRYLIRGQLAYRRFHKIPRMIYNELWNKNEVQRAKGLEKINETTEMLKRCVILSKLLKDTATVDFYKRKMPD